MPKTKPPKKQSKADIIRKLISEGETDIKTLIAESGATYSQAHSLLKRHNHVKVVTAKTKVKPAQNIIYIDPEDLRMWAKHMCGDKYGEALKKIEMMRSQGKQANAYWGDDAVIFVK